MAREGSGCVRSGLRHEWRAAKGCNSSSSAVSEQPQFGQLSARRVVVDDGSSAASRPPAQPASSPGPRTMPRAIHARHQSSCHRTHAYPLGAPGASVGEARAPGVSRSPRGSREDARPARAPLPQLQPSRCAAAVARNAQWRLTESFTSSSPRNMPALAAISCETPRCSREARLRTRSPWARPQPRPRCARSERRAAKRAPILVQNAVKQKFRVEAGLCLRSAAGAMAPFAASTGDSAAVTVGVTAPSRRRGQGGSPRLHCPRAAGARRPRPPDHTRDGASLSRCEALAPARVGARRKPRHARAHVHSSGDTTEGNRTPQRGDALTPSPSSASSSPAAPSSRSSAPR